MYQKIFMLIMLFVFAFKVQAQHGNSILNIEVTIKTDSISKQKLLEKLTEEFDIYFSYNPELINANDRVKIETRNAPLYTILQEITNTKLFNFKAFDNQVVFFPVEQAQNQTKKEQFITIKGIVYEQDSKSPIPFCNIALSGKAIGTMSNNNGYFEIKLPEQYRNDTLGFSSIGYKINYLPVQQLLLDYNEVALIPKTYNLRQIDVIQYNPEQLLKNVYLNIHKNYETEYTLLTNYYRETTLENDEYTDISEAVIQVMKAPYTNEIRQDHVKFIKGRKAAELRPHTNIRFRLMGGPYYITKLDIVKNNESFLNPDFKHLYFFKFEEITTIDNRQTAVLSFKPAYSVRHILYEGTLYIDTETFAVVRSEFSLTRLGLREAQSSLIQKKPRNSRAIPTSLEYSVQYKLIDDKWYLLSARSTIEIKINTRNWRERTNFKSIAEIVSTNIEKGDLQKFNRGEIFRANEIFTDKIVSYDENFWQNYNIIKPEEKLVDALKAFDNRNLFITHTNKKP